MKNIKVSWLIHVFALLHAAVALLCRLAGVEDELLLTILTMAMVLLICVRRKLNVEFTAASIILANIIGYLLGNAGAAIFTYLVGSTYTAHALATAATTEILGWSITGFSEALSNFKNESKPLSYKYIRWIVLAMVAAFTIRVGIIFLVSSEIFIPGALLKATAKLFSSTFAIISLICINILHVRYSGRFNQKLTDVQQFALMIPFMFVSAFIGAGLACIGIPFELTIDTWMQFVYIYLVALIAQLTIYCIVFMVNYTISTGNKIKEEKEKKHLAQYRYQILKRQVNPHFLFNSLNALDCLVCDVKTEQASQYIHKLAGIYRYMLKSEEEELVRLSDELTFVDMYVDLLKVRFPEGYEVIINVQEQDKARFVLPCSIQLLIENASKHNAVGAETPLVIRVESDGAQVKVTNNIIPKVTRSQSTGLGQKYIRQQYMDLSGKEIIIERTEKEYSVILPLI